MPLKVFRLGAQFDVPDGIARDVVLRAAVADGKAVPRKQYVCHGTFNVVGSQGIHAVGRHLLLGNSRAGNYTR